MEPLHFNFRDIFRTIRYGFSGRKIAVHFIGLASAYLIYEVLVYLSLFIFDGPTVHTFWKTHGLLPVSPFAREEGLSHFTRWSMWIGGASFAGIFFLASTIASKITIEQLRGDFFFSIGDAIKFLKLRWKTVFGVFMGLLLILSFFALIPLSIAALGQLPGFGKPILVFASLFAPISIFLGLLMSFIAVVFIISLFFVPAVVATTGADAFETIYQQFAIAWNQPWRIVGYELLLFATKLILVPSWALFCVGSVFIPMLPFRYLYPIETRHLIHYANKWLGGETLQALWQFIFSTSVDISERIVSFWTFVSAVFFTITVIVTVFLILAYLFSIASAGNTVIYTILRKQIDGQNLLQTEKTQL